MTGLALVLVAEPAAGVPAEARPTAWAAANGATVSTCAPGGRLRAAVAAFAAGHAAVLLADGPAPPDALLGLAAAELAAPMTAVLGPAHGGRLAFVGLTEIVPALIAADRFDDALAAAIDAGLNAVVLPEVGDDDAG